MSSGCATVSARIDTLHCALVVDVDTGIAAQLARGLRLSGYAVVHETDGAQAVPCVLEHDWGLLVLDTAVEGIDSFELCRTVRQRCPLTPIVLVLPAASDRDRIRGLELGADEVLTRPVIARELDARIHSLMRRAPGATAPAQHTKTRVGDIEIDRASQEAKAAGKPLDLTPREFDLLCLLAESPGKVFRRRELLRRVWGDDTCAKRHTVNSHVNRLRAKLEIDPANPLRIVTVWGVGYKLNG